jgi:prophage antirepressor-like protein
MNATENQIVVYQPNETVRLDVRLENETVWLTQEQIADLFGTKRPAITKHLANIYKSGELEREGTCSILEHMGNDGKQTYRTTFYNLDAILSVGYRVNSRHATLFRRWATQVLKTYLLKGYAVNARLNQLEDKVDRRLSRTEADVAALKDKVDFFVQTRTPPLQGVFYAGQLWDARALVAKLVAGAKKSILLIDNWATAEVLDLFAKKRKGVKVTIVTSEHFNKKHVPSRKISEADVKAFNGQYPTLSVRYSEAFHDRFLIIDDRELYLVGASLKDLGRKCFGFTRMDAGEIRRIKKAAFAGSEKGRTG